MTPPHLTLAAGTALALAIGLAGCSEPDPAPEPPPVVVASTDVYADLATLVAGEDVEVTALLDGGQDPSSLEADPGATAALAAADVVVLNGGGVDDVVLDLLDQTGNDDAAVVRAFELTGLDAADPPVDAFLWYRPVFMQNVAATIGDALGEADPEHESSYDSRVKIALHWISLVDRNIATLEDATRGMGVLLTGRAPALLVDALGMTEVTPPDLVGATRAGSAPSDEAIAAAVQSVAAGEVRFVFHDPGGDGDAAAAILAAAEAHGVPIVETAMSIPTDIEPLDDAMRSRWLAWQVDILAQIRSELGLIIEL